MPSNSYETNKKKAFYYFMFLYFLFASSLDMFSKKVYFEKGEIKSIKLKKAITSEPEINDDNTILQSYTYDALYDFPNINAGQVNYYKDKIRGVLAIKASVIAVRNKFAKAEKTFSGENGTYNIKLTTLAEFDGECTYRFLVNGIVLGTFTNPAVIEENDYKQQNVIFEAISIKKEDVIAIESNTHTNGKIQEGTGSAWARGRWKRISMTLIE